MTTNKNRLAKLESVTLGTVEVKDRLFIQEVRTESSKYFIDGVPCEEVKYKKELAKYLQTHKNNNVPVEIVVNLVEGET